MKKIISQWLITRVIHLHTSQVRTWQPEKALCYLAVLFTPNSELKRTLHRHVCAALQKICKVTVCHVQLEVCFSTNSRHRARLIWSWVRSSYGDGCSSVEGLWMNTLMSKIWHQKFKTPWWIPVKTQTGEVSCSITSSYMKCPCSGVTVTAVSTEKYLSQKSFESTKRTWYPGSIHYICAESNEKKSRKLWFLVFWETGLWDTALCHRWSYAQFTGKEGLSIKEKWYGSTLWRNIFHTYRYFYCSPLFLRFWGLKDLHIHKSAVTLAFIRILPLKSWMLSIEWPEDIERICSTTEIIAA